MRLLRERSPARSGERAVVALFSVTLFLSAGLMFLVQPMFAKFILPLFGSTPAVWNASMLFFQTTLLAGYLYAHESTRRLGVRRQVALHVGVLAVPLLVLPIGVPADWIPPAESNPVLPLLGLLAVAVGLPFFVVSSTAPLLQRWLAGTSHPAATDPYFLYRASNLGSVLGLLAYPLALEPSLRLAEQGRLWSAGYGLLVVLMLACAVVIRRARPAAAAAEREPPPDGSVPAAAESEAAATAAEAAPAEGAAAEGEGVAANPTSAAHDPGPAAHDPGPAAHDPGPDAHDPGPDAHKPGPDATEPGGPGGPARITPERRLRWVGLAFVPSSLLLGVTATITTDLAPLPLLWALPLSLYLVSFILVFSPGARNARLHGWMVNALPAVVLLLLILILLEVHDPLWLVLPTHLAGFFVAAMVCHGELARDRPRARSLTEFYLLISLGGALGGVFNAIVAPVLFNSLAEYPVAIVLAALCLPKRPPRIPPGPYARWLDIGLPLLFGAVVALIVALIGLAGEEAQRPGKMLAFGMAAGVAVNFVRRPLRFGLTVGAIALAVTLATSSDDRELYRERSFFGVYRVTAAQQEDLHELVHGTTTHGRQDFSPGRESTPISYYHRQGPIGRVLTAAPESLTSRVGIIGLGTGSIACYSAPGERWTFYEIDPTVERIARDPELFTYLRVCPGELDVVLGDARLSLEDARDGGYGVIVADAFSSDTVPVHLLTRQALALYRSKLRNDGVLAFNVSNRYLTLEPVLGNLARGAGMACVAQGDDRSQHDERPDTDASDWVVMSKRARDVRAVAPARSGWRACHRSPGTPVWTDDFSNLIGAVDLDG